MTDEPDDPRTALDDLHTTLNTLARHSLGPEKARDLLESVLVVSQGLDLDQALQRIADVAARVLDARYAALGVRAADGGLRAFVHTGISPEVRATMGSLPRGRGVLGVLINDPKVLRIPDLSKHPASVGFPPNHPPMRSFLGAPILIRGEVFGSIYLTEKRTAPAFSAVDEALIGVLAVAAGIAVDNARGFERARIRHTWMELIARRGAEPLAGISLVANLNSMCADVAELTGARAVYVYQTEDSAATLRANWGWPGPVDAVRFGEAITESAQLRVVADDEMPGWGDPQGGWLTLVPLVRGPWVYGAIVIHQDTKPDWEAEERSGLAGVAEIASLAIAYAERREMGRRLEVLEDRHRIARDLHDHVIQRLFAMGLSLQALAAQGKPGDTADASDRLAQVLSDLDGTIAQIRTSIFDLQTGDSSRSPTLRRRVLAVVGQVSGHAEVTPMVRFDGPVDTVVVPELASHVDAVVREGVSNALRHSGADRIEVRVVAEPRAGELIVEVTDDGRGISPGVRRSGLENLRMRAQEWEGEFTVGPGLNGRGTRLLWQVPLVEQKRD
ncbi:GAF domain-containing protein [Gordonia sp. X0973]|uniref:sensor histidine kinase n=1 Tax=Gordonia sp. X0973 TaxID=2742602 RepID=UPI000F545BC8|nr:GAF domain-containing protein [Gordonia sp. X0973]QKT07077.1 GAF domain-containing protein [Gordonia sp. X0973]